MKFVYLMGWLALVFAILEIVQLLVAQRYIGIEQIRRKQHPADLAVVPSFKFSATWIVLMLAGYVFQATLMFTPMVQLIVAEVSHPYLIRVAAFLMILASLGGFAVRRICGLKWGLVILTFECAMRAGFMLYVFNAIVTRVQYLGRYT